MHIINGINFLGDLLYFLKSIYNYKKGSTT